MRFADTDAAGMVHYARYLAFFEAGRAEALRQLRMPEAQVTLCTLRAPVLEATIRYRAPARFDDLLIVQARVIDLAVPQFRFGYEIHRAADEALIATGETLHAWTDPGLLDRSDPPAWLVAALERLRAAE